MNKYWTYYFREKDRYHQVVESSDTNSMVFQKRINSNRIFETKQEAMKALYNRHGIQSDGKGVPNSK